MNCPGPQNMGASFNHSGNSLQHECDIRAALLDKGWRHARRALPTTNVLKHRPDQPPDKGTCLPNSPCSAPSDGKSLTLFPDSTHPREAQGKGVPVVMLEQQGKEEAQTGCVKVASILMPTTVINKKP